MENKDEKLEGGLDDIWYHDDIDGEFDAAWQSAIGTILLKYVQSRYEEIEDIARHKIEY